MTLPEFMKKYGYVYSLLRLAKDTRPAFLRQLGIREVVMNEEIVKYELPRRYSCRRKKGSYFNEYLSNLNEILSEAEIFIKGST
jgi:hypothetical protein